MSRRIFAVLVMVIDYLNSGICVFPLCDFLGVQLSFAE
jgi:hypothetical protein